jgi:hypothetical protein
MEIVCAQGAPDIYRPHEKAAVCRQVPIGYDKIVCGNELLGIHVRESNLLYSTMLAQCQNKVDVLRYQYRWEIEAHRCRDEECVANINDKRDQVNVAALNHFPADRMCALPGQPMTPFEDTANSDDPAVHAQVAYTRCGFKAADEVDDGVSPAAQIAGAIVARCHEEAQLWAYAGHQSVAAFLQVLATEPYTTNIVLEARAKRRSAQEQKPAQKQVRPHGGGATSL